MQESLSHQAPRIARVGEVLARLRAMVRDAFPPLWIAGEVSNLRRAASGHVYFTLKDRDGQLRCALFRRDAERVPFALEDGLEVIAFGEVGVYEARGDLQLIVRQMEPRGQGALQLAFDQLRQRLEKEGLFDRERKRELPTFPTTLGIVTSQSGAALRDMLRVFRERGPTLRLLVSPARVQGAAADLEIVSAMQRLAAHGEAQVIVLARGGGSLEDLWCFNSEALARAVARSPVPVVTGVGHETDLTIADLAADWSAATPSAAAAQVAPEREWWRERVAALADRSRRAVCARVRGERDRSIALRRALRGLSPKARLEARRARFAGLAATLRAETLRALRRRAQHLDASAGRLANTPAALGIAAKRGRIAFALGGVRAATQTRLHDSRAALAVAATTLDTLSPLAVLGRGYSIVRRASDDRILRAPEEVAVGDELRLRLAGGELAAHVSGAPGDATTKG